MKKMLLLSILLLSSFALIACNGDDNDDVDPDDLRAFTLEELSAYDGLDGADAYIAVDGYVYDVTNSRQWTDGEHQGRVQAGQDLTDVLDEESTHGREMLDRVPKIGYLVDEDNNEENDLQTFTLETLAQYDGSDGNNAYIAVDGYVYDVTNSSLWTGGEHQNTVQAGQDLTHEIDTISPHGRRVLDGIPKIGVLEDD